MIATRAMSLLERLVLDGEEGNGCTGDIVTFFKGICHL